VDRLAQNSSDVVSSWDAITGVEILISGAASMVCLSDQVNAASALG
jgi:hypothetical protein